MGYFTKANLDLKHAIFVGNDLNDLECMKLVGYPIAPPDAHPELRNIAKIVPKTPGGTGVVRKIAELLSQGNN